MTTAALYPPTATPSARALPLLPFLARFIRNPLRSLPRAVYDQPVVTYGRKRPLVAWVTDPALIERILLSDAENFPKTRLDRRVLKPIVGEGLLTAEGESWRWQRKLASPLFRRSELLNYVPVILEAAQQRTAIWRAGGANRLTAIDNDMTETTFSVITRTILAGIDESEADAIKEAARAYLDPITWEVAASLLMIPETAWHPGKRRMRQAAVRSRAVVARLLEKRRHAGSAGDDLVARLITARDPDTGLPMPDDMIVDNLTTFLLAGHETTAKALTWSLYLLARAPEWQDRLREEIRGVTGSGAITAETIAQLPLTARFLKESMRLYPPVPVITRVTSDDVDIGGKHLPKPTLIVIPIFALHRHKLLWSDPDRFDPDRFLPENEAKRPRTQFMPFGYGPRICIGSAFANLEAITLLAEFLRTTSFAWDGRHAPEPISRVTLRPKGGMPLLVSPL
ncbi:cytochrome P450 [Hyphomicrobium methylovorum]|uniref:cytochrome P450 n=1 Tax=Hyphomicrobium methylovorum TaxID=84 RepID=UPI0015E6DDDC|nr:cytochrome P450 [Hyphomicrobium methylovorum]MBA2127164.1 cytochrome P450 [Hyphomicrobium methylovorum]